MATMIDVKELPARFREVLSLSKSGEEIIVTEGGVPLARLFAILPGNPRIPGLHPGALEPAEDFDAPLPSEFWTDSPS